jgi:hypothetical protein
MKTRSGKEANETIDYTAMRAAPFGPVTMALCGVQDVSAFFERAVEGLAGECCPWQPDEAAMLAEDARYEACRMGEE